MPMERLHHADPDEHRRAVMFSTSNNASIAACHCSASCSALDKFMMYGAASRSVTNGFRSDNMIGSKNSCPTTPKLPRYANGCVAPGARRTMSEITI